MKIPNSDGELFDRLAALFGYGTYDDVAAADVPYWKWRMKEINKVAATRKKNDCSLLEAARIAEFCKATGVVITGPHQLWKHRAAARRWWVQKDHEEFEQRLMGLINEAIAFEAATDPDGSWMHRLLMATGQNRVEVYKQWEKARLHLVRASSPA